MKDLSKEYEYAGFWIRVWADIIDTLILAIIIAPLLTLIYGESYWEQPIDKISIKGFYDVFLNYILPAVAVICFWTYKSTTPGKMAIKAKIADAKTGEEISVTQAIIRYLGYFISSIPIGLGLFWIAWDSRKQGWHDKIAGTVVIRLKNRDPEPVIFPEK